jgi:hypothetical protein
MPIAAADIDFRLSGGAANSDVNASLGGAKSSTEVTDASLHNLFDQVSSAESAAGDTEYRCIYVHNAHASLSLQNAVIWIQTQTPSADTSVEIAVGSAAINGTEQTVANESTAPTGVTFGTPANEGAAQALGTIPAGQHKAVWIKRIVNAAAAAANSDSVVLRVKGDTAA